MNKENINKPNNYYSNVRLDVYKNIEKKQYKSILEIGGGDFQLLSILKEEFGASCTGVDLVELEAPNNIDTIVGSIESSAVIEELKERDYDLVIANDVIEHLVDPAATLKSLRELCQTGASLHISVPNIRQVRALFHIFLRGTFPSNDSGLFDRTHLHWFCKKDILDLVEISGFNVESVYIKGRFVPDFLRTSFIAEFIGLQTVVIAKAV